MLVFRISDNPFRIYIPAGNVTFKTIILLILNLRKTEKDHNQLLVIVGI